MKKIIISFVIILITIFGINNVFAFDEVKMTDNEIIKKFNLKKRIAYNYRWGEMKTFLTKKGNEVVYYNGKISKEYKKIYDGRNYYHMDMIVWESGLTKESIFSRTSLNKENIIFEAEKLNGKTVIVKNFIEGPEFDKINDYKFSKNNNNIIYAIKNKSGGESIYVNDKFVYKRNKKFDNELDVSDNGIYIIGNRNEDGKVIFNYNGKIFKTEYFEIEKLFISENGTNYGAKVKIEKDGEYNKLSKNGKIILDLNQFVKIDSFGEKDYDNYYLIGVSNEGFLYGYAYINTNESYLVIDNNILRLRKGTFFYPVSDLNIISFGNGIFAGLVREDELNKTVLYIYNKKTNKIRYSKNYKYFSQLRYEDGYIAFKGKKEDGTYKFVHNLIEYDFVFNKSSIQSWLKININNLKKKKNGEKLRKKIDLLINKMSDKKMKKILKVLISLKIKNPKTNEYNPKYYKYKDILYYIQNKIMLKLLYK